MNNYQIRKQTLKTGIMFVTFFINETFCNFW